MAVASKHNFSFYLEVNHNSLLVNVIYKPIKNLYFRLDKQGNLQVTCSRQFRERHIRKVLETSPDSILKMLKIYQRRQEKEQWFYLFGKKYNLLIDKTISQIIMDENNIIIPNEKTLEKYIKNILIQRVDYYSNIISFVPKFTLKIRKMTSRWGVCNKRTNSVTLNYNLYRQDKDFIDYVIIHELCHFRHMNHSKDFYSTVKNYMPNYKEVIKKYKES